MMLQKGFSIVELMIAITLSLLLGIGIFQVFTSNQESARLTQALVEVQDTGRLSLDLIARDIRNAGYWGCAGGLDRVNSTIDTGGTDYDAEFQLPRRCQLCRRHCLLVTTTILLKAML